MKKEELRELPPEERIKKLKELEEERKKEIAQAKELIKESEDELTDREKWVEKVPIPEVATKDTTGLSEEGKRIVELQRGVTKPQEEEVEQESPQEVNLEDTVEREAPARTPPEVIFPFQQGFFEANSEYIASQSRLSTQQLQHEMQRIYDNVESRGYMTWEEQRSAMATYHALEEKMKAGTEGKYEMSESVAAQASLTKQLTGRLLDNAYQANKSGSFKPANWYSG